MPQGVYVDSRNNVRVVEVGPPGPPGFGGSGGGPSGPSELLPITMSRLVPFVGWSQMSVPFNTMAWFGHRIGLAFASMPIMGYAAETIMTPAPIYTARVAETLNFKISAFGANFEDDTFPEGAKLRVVMVSRMINGDDPHTETILGTRDLGSLSFASPPGADVDFEEIIDEYTMQFEIELAANEAIGAFRMDVLTEDEAPWPDDDFFNTLGLLRTSLWKGSPDAKAQVNPYLASTWLGQQVTTAMATAYNMSVVNGTVMLATGSGLIGTAIDLDEVEGVTSPGNATFMLEPFEDEADPDGVSVRWRASRLAVDSPPVAGTDVLRLIDVPDFTSDGLRMLVPSVNKQSVAEGTVVNPGEAGIYEITDLDGTMSSFSFSWGNVPAGFVAAPLVVVHGPSTGMNNIVVNGSDSTAVSHVISAGEKWVIKSLVSHKDPSESPDVGVVSVDFIKIQSAPSVLAEYPEVPKTRLSSVGLAGGKVPIDASVAWLDVADGSEIEFENPGEGKYAIFEFQYTTGASGEGYRIENANHYQGGTTASPGTMLANSLYHWRVMVVGTESGPPASDFAGIDVP